MRVLGVCGPSGVGKTTLIEALIAELKARGQRVSVVKHAHERFEIDRPGKDSWRFREAGTHEVLIASAHRLALIRESATPIEPRVEELLAELSPCDWALVEGFKLASLRKLEVWRAALGEPPIYPGDPQVVAIATCDRLPVATALPVFALTGAAALASHLLQTGDRHEYIQA